MKIDSCTIRYIVILFLLPLLTGCFSNRKNVTIEISNRFWNDTIHVDVACINDVMYRQYELCSKEEYWGMDSVLRIDLHTESFIFDINHPTKQKLSEDSLIWNYWKNDDYLMILVDIPKSYIGVPWKIVIPLEFYSWFNFWDERDIFVYISDKGLIRLDNEVVYSKPSFISQKDMERYIK
jgi:hypothetical protein